MTSNNQPGNSRKILGPFNRVEGDLEVQVEITEGRVSNAWVVSPLYRGFEQMLRGRHPLDALVYVPRICGICSVAQSVAAARALASLTGQPIPDNGRLATNLILACENIADHLTHFYLFFMPDFARETYRQQAFFSDTVNRFKAVSGTAANDVLPARAAFLNIMGLLAGKWPHSLAIQPGGTTRALPLREKNQLRTLLFSFREFLQQCLFGDTLETIASLQSSQALHHWRSQLPVHHSDLTRFLAIADTLNLQTLGRGYDHFLSYGVYDQRDGMLFDAGTRTTADTPRPFTPDDIFEDTSHSWMNTGGATALHPFQGETQPAMDNSEGYSWCKSPRLNHQPMEVGALARQYVSGHPLIEDLVNISGGNVQNRIIARLLEIARVVIAMENWAQQLQPGEPFCTRWDMPNQARGAGMMEAARGSLGHWVSIERGKIMNYQIIAPTTWNFSPRDSNDIPGPLEKALLGTEVDEQEKDSVAIQHIVRSFDPCMVCTVH